MALENKVHATRLLALQRAEELGNVSEACRELGISRSLFYRWKDRYERYGRDGLHPRRLADVLLPLYEAAGWLLQRVLTDWGSEGV